MTREEVFERLNKVFRDVFDDDDITVTETTTSADIDDWDSLEHINLVAAVEQEFGMKFTMGQVVTMKNVGEMVDIILFPVLCGGSVCGVLPVAGETAGTVSAACKHRIFSDCRKCVPDSLSGSDHYNYIRCGIVY